MPIAIIRPSAIGSLGNGWTLSAGASKQAAVDPGDPVSHDDNGTYISVAAAPGANLQSFYMNTWSATIVDISNVYVLARGGLSSGGVETLTVLLYRAGVSGAAVTTTGAYYTTFGTSGYARPSGGTWVAADFATNNIQLTCNVPTDSALAARMTSMWIEVTYTAPSGGFAMFVASLLGAVPAGLLLADMPKLAAEVLRCSHLRYGVHRTGAVRIPPSEYQSALDDLKAYRYPSHVLIGR